MRARTALQHEAMREAGPLTTALSPPPESRSLTCAVPLLRIQSEATVAPALEAADGVSALAMGTEAGYHLALVDIFRKRKMQGRKAYGQTVRISHGSLLTPRGLEGLGLGPWQYPSRKRMVVQG